MLTSTKPSSSWQADSRQEQEDSPTDSTTFQVKNAKEELEQFSTSFKNAWNVFSWTFAAEEIVATGMFAFFFALQLHLCNKKEISWKKMAVSGDWLTNRDG